MHLPKIDREIKQIRKMIPLLFLISGFGFSQNLNSNKGHDVDYLVFDASKSLPGNEIIDHLFFLKTNSTDVVLPASVIQMLDGVQEDPQLHSKLNFMRESILKVLYNERISPEDKSFMCNHYLNEFYVNDYRYLPIIPILRTYAETGTYSSI